jgi:hypothetical protein
LDPDIGAMIARELAERKTTLKAVINERLRRGFAADVERTRYELPNPLDLGAPFIHNFDNIADVLDLIANDSR